MEIIAAILTTVFAIVAAYAVPMLIEMRKTAREARETFSMVRQWIPPIAHDLQRIASHVEGLTNRLQDSMESLSDFFELTGTLNRRLAGFNQWLTGSGQGLAVKSLLMGFGIRLASRFAHRWFSTRAHQPQQEVTNGTERSAR